MQVKELLDFTLFIEAKELQEGVETAIASETSLMKDWLILLCHITDKSTACGGMTSNRLENKTNIKRLNEWLI